MTGMSQQLVDIDRPSVLDARISDVSRDRDFGCVEALVTLTLKSQSQAPRIVSVRTHAPGGEGLRGRLIRDAARLAHHVSAPVRLGHAA